MPETNVITAESRSRFGNRVKALRREGRIPGNLISSGRNSQPLQLDEHAMAAYVRNFGRSGLVELNLNGGSELALVDSVQVHPVTRRVLHVVLRHVDANVPVNVDIPVEYVGESPADTRSDLYVVRIVDSLSVNALPRHIPVSLPVDVGGLADAGDAFNAGDLDLPEGVTLVSSPDITLAHVERSRLATDDELDEDDGLTGLAGEIPAAE